MPRRRLHSTLAFASVALVLAAAALSNGGKWNFDFAQYRGPARTEPKDEFRFVMVGDRTGGAVWGLMPQAFREINHLYPDFVVSVGDLIDGGGETPEAINPIWNEFDKEVANLKCPFVYMPGNHDIWSPTSKGVYEARYGPTYRSFNYRGLHFITLDTEERRGAPERFEGGRRGGLSAEQLKWVKEDIAKNRDARRILILMHQPIWNFGGLDELYPALEGLRVNIFAGHYHKYSYQEIRGIPHIILGATAASMPEDGIEAIGRFRHYVLATVRDNDLKLALIRLGGVMSPEVVLEEDGLPVRQLADAAAIWRESNEPDAPVRLVFRNPLNVPVKVQIERTNKVSGKGASLFSSEEPSLAAGQALDQKVDWKVLADGASPKASLEYRAVFRFTNSHGEAQSIDFPIEPHVKRVATAIAMATPPSIDGDLAEWSNAQWQTLGDPSQVSDGRDRWKGPEDLSAQFALAEDDKNIYVAVRVVDDVVAYSSSPGESDSVELFTAGPANREISFNVDADWHRFVIAPFAADGNSAGDRSGAASVRELEGARYWGAFGARQGRDKRDAVKAKAAFMRQDHGYTLEIALPRKDLGWDGATGGPYELDIAINDRDMGDRREKQLTWCGTASGTGSDLYGSRYFGRVRLPAP